MQGAVGMSEAGEATGTLADGNLGSCAIELESGNAREARSSSSSDGHTEELACLNCGTG